MQRHILASPAQCHIKCFTVKSLRRNHYIFRSPPLWLVRGRHPAVFERGIIFRKIHQTTLPAIGIQQHDFIRIVSNPVDTSIINLSMLYIDIELDQIALT